MLLVWTELVQTALQWPKTKRDNLAPQALMPTRETVLTSLPARLSTMPATVLRNEVLPERLPPEGLLILRDGQPGEAEVTLSPLHYHWQHRAELEEFMRGGLDAAFDTLLANIGAILAPT